MKKILKSITLIAFPFLAFSQNSEDALRYSENGLGGTARFVSMSGSFGALGADLSAIHYNPAGLGVFRKSQFTFSPVYVQTDASSIFLNTETEENRIGFKINNLGMAIVMPQEKNSDWSFVNIAVSYSLLTDFNSDVRLRNDDFSTSLGNQFAEQAEGKQASNIGDDMPYSSGLAYNAYLIDPINADSNSYRSKTFGKDVNMSRRLKEKGHIGETAISVGANYQQKFFVGATIGITRVRYSSAVIHTEELVDETADLKEFTFREDLTVSGSGINLKLGGIYQLASWVRVGLSWHSPTNISLNDKFNTSINTQFNKAPFENTTSFDESSGETVYEYRIVTPSRFMYSIALIAGNRGAINIDYERTNYSNAKLKPSYEVNAGSYEFDKENEQIKNILIAGNRLKIGGEYRFGPWALRGGVSTSSNPFSSDVIDNKETTKGLTLGTGYSQEHWFIDFAFSKLTSTRDYYPFATSDFEQGALIKKEMSQIAFTCGLKF